jgi:predicted amidohydrolase YtcJ
MVVWDRDLYTTTTAELKEIMAEKTFLEGKLVYEV